jgi:hypothetical protein
MEKVRCSPPHRRDRVPSEDTVDDHGDAMLATGLDEVGDLGLKRRKAAGVLGYLFAVYPPLRGGWPSQSAE